MDIDSDMAASVIAWGVLHKGCRAPVKGFGVEIKVGLELILSVDP